MDHLSEPMQKIIRDYSAGSVATVDADGAPAVSPKATFSFKGLLKKLSGTVL